MVALTQVGLLTAKIETTPGVDAAPDPDTDFILALNTAYNPNFNVIERNYMRPSISGTPIVMGRQLAQVTFTTEIYGSGTAATAAKWADLFEACAMVQADITGPPASSLYSPVTTGQKTATIYCYYEGIVHKLTGAMGTFSLTAKAGEIGTIQWTFTGRYNDPAALTTPTPTIPSTTPPLVETLGFHIGATASTVFIPEQVTLDIGNNVAPRDDVNSAKGFNSMIITSRKPSITVNPESVPEASHPFWADFSGSVEKAVTWTIGSVAGDKFKFTLPNFQTTDLKYADRGGIRVYDITGRASSLAGDDEVQINFL